MSADRKGKNAKEMQAVGWTKSTDEAGQCRRREVEKGLFLTILPCEVISKRKHYLYTEIGTMMETKLARISQLSKENPKMVFTSIGHLINEDMLKHCHEKMDGDKAVGIDGVTKEEYSRNLEENLHNLVNRLKQKACKASGSTERQWKDQTTQYLLL